MTQNLQSPGSRRSPVSARSLRLPPAANRNQSPAEVYALNRYPNRQYAWQVAASLHKSFNYAWQGINYAFQTQRNFKIHTIVGTIAICLGCYLQFRPEQFAILLLTIGFVMGTELLNTAIESVVDLAVQQTYHELAKIAKDCAAGAVLVSAAVSLVVALFLYVPAIWLRWQSLA
ncbi:MAG: diacylglycerol kinase family protein [Prochlorothrix sp.]|jgi:diacylglycerol kinase (ATP)